MAVIRKRLRKNYFYVYEHVRPDTGLPFYVGKGHGRRAFDLKDRGRSQRAVATKLTRLGLTVEVRIIFNRLDEDMAFTLEKSHIAYLRRRGIDLVNLTDGGDGASGYQHKAKARKAFRAYWDDPRAKKAHIEAITIALNKPEVKHHLREIALAQLANPEFKARRDAAVKKALSKPGVMDRRNASIRAALSRPETRQRLSIASKASRTPDVRAQISATLKATLAARKAAATEGASC